MRGGLVKTRLIASLLHIEFRIQVKDLEAELKLRERNIRTLDIKVKDFQDLVASMSTKTDQAGQQVRDIALKAIGKSGVVGVPMERREKE